MKLIITIATIYVIYKLIALAVSSAREKARQAELNRVLRAQERQKREQARLREEWKQEQLEARERVKRMVEIEREQVRQAKELEKQAAQIAKHEEQLMKIEMRLSSAESEIAFNREQRERLWKLLKIEERERDGAIEGSGTWQKHHRKVISLENQIHTVQKRIDKAQMDKAFCERKLSA